MSDIDPIQFGMLTAQVKTLENQVEALTSKVDALLELANRSKGGFWAGMTIAAGLGSLASWLASHTNLFPR